MTPILHKLGETGRLTLASLLALAVHGTLLFGVSAERWWQHPIERLSVKMILLPPVQRLSTLPHDDPVKPAVPTDGSTERAVAPITPDSAPSAPIPASIALPSPEFIGPSQSVSTKPPLSAKTHPTPANRLGLKPPLKASPADSSKAPDTPKARPVTPLPVKPLPSSKPTRPASEKSLAASTKPPLKRPVAAHRPTQWAEPELDEPIPTANIPASSDTDRQAQAVTTTRPRTDQAQAVTTTRSTVQKRGRRPLDSSALLGQIASLETQSQRQAHTGVRAKRVSPTDSQSLEGFYISSWVRKVEQIGEMNFPDIARQLNLSTGPTLEVAIRADGSLQDVRVARSSGNAELDRAAQRIVRLGAPYAAFPPQLRQQYDLLYISRPWRFESSGRLRMR